MARRKPAGQTPLEIVLSRLEGVRRTSDGYMARCPAHDDHHPSLSIGEGEDGRILLHCWAGCATAEVLAALGIGWADLFPSRHRWGRR